ncbi:MAG: hypothetical protein Q7I94_05170 [Candidatus Contubernalis sp.]|nr:hypothetical protein [Candidatus Contubernalis sp.]
MVISEKPFEVIGDEAFEKARGFVNSSNLIIDSGFPVGSLNKRNLDLALLALKHGKKVYTLRDEASCREIYGEQSRDSIICCKNTGELFHQISPVLVKAV